MNALPEDPSAALQKLYDQYEAKMAEIGLGIPPAVSESPERELAELTERYKQAIAAGLREASDKEARDAAESAIRLAQASAKEELSDTVRLEAIQDRCRLQGIQLHEIDGEDGRPLFVAVKWACIATFHTVDELAAWLSRIDGKQE